MEKVARVGHRGLVCVAGDEVVGDDERLAGAEVAGVVECYGGEW